MFSIYLKKIDFYLYSLIFLFFSNLLGSITIDGTDIKALNLEWLRKSIGVVSQEPILFSFSIRDNILYGAPEGVATDEKTIEDVLYKANALEFVKRMPKGLDTVVGERGVMLSGKI